MVKVLSAAVTSINSIDDANSFFSCSVRLELIWNDPHAVEYLQRSGGNLDGLFRPVLSPVFSSAEPGISHQEFKYFRIEKEGPHPKHWEDGQSLSYPNI